MKVLLKGIAGLLALACACGSPPEEVPSSVKEAREGVVLLCGAVENYVILNGGEYPPNLEVLVVTDQNRGAFLSRRRSLIDPWGRDYIYERPRPGVRGYRIMTYGRDGIAGGEGADSDLDSWMIADGVR